MLCCRYDGERGVDEDEAGGDRYDDDGRGLMNIHAVLQVRR